MKVSQMFIESVIKGEFLLLQNVFDYILRNGLSVCVVILLIFSVRLLICNAPKKYSYILWVIVGIYLVCPVRVSSPISIYNLTNIVSGVFNEKSSLPADRIIKENISGNVHIDNEKSQNIVVSGSSNDDFKKDNKDNQIEISGKKADVQSLFITVVSRIWICGCVLLFVWNLLLICRTKKNISMAIRRKFNVYECDRISTPFVFGLVKPKIYIPISLDESECEYIIMHEQHHIQRKDYMIKFCAYVLCVIYWFQPLVWLAYFAMVRDMEMSCDEYVLQKNKKDIRAAYSTSLLNFSVKSHTLSAGMLAFGESDTGKRVKNIMKFNTKKKWLSIVAMAVIVFAGISCLTNADKKANMRQNKIVDIKDENSENVISVDAIPESANSSAEFIIKKIQHVFQKNCIRKCFIMEKYIWKNISRVIYLVVLKIKIWIIRFILICFLTVMGF